LKFRFEIVLFLIITFIAVVLQWPYLFDFPGYIHGWAQVDRYALSMGFLRNGFDLFHPETYVYNQIYPGECLVQSSATISAIDFPVHDYFVALMMKLTNFQAPWLFRIYVILMGCMGLFNLGKLARLLLKDDIKALFVMLFGALSPIYVYYQGTLLPSIPSLSLTIAGVYQYFCFRATRDQRHLHMSFVFVGIALLSRTTFVIPFIVLLAMEFFSVLKDRKVEWKRYIIVGPIVVIFFLYRWHNNTLLHEYGSMFLHRLTPPESKHEVWFLFNYIWDHWRFAYFSSIHYWAVVVVIASIVISFFRKTLKRQSIGLLLSFTGIYLLGCFLFLAAMLKQFQDHDYYFIDTFFLPSILILIALLAHSPIAGNRLARIGSMIVFLLFVGFAFQKSLKSQRNRHEAGVDKRLQNTIENFTDADHYLDTLGVPSDATLLILDAVTPNTALTLMNRKGLVVVWVDKGILEHSFEWDFDYVVFQNEYFQDQIYRIYPEVLSRMKKLGSNGRITVCIPQEGNVQTLNEFLGLSGNSQLQ
jgi:hypothetical protein